MIGFCDEDGDFVELSVQEVFDEMDSDEKQEMLDLLASEGFGDFIPQNMAEQIEQEEFVKRMLEKRRML
jgi:predicted component of type VI protein secretion system